jgi:hypothetical protein
MYAVPPVELIVNIFEPADVMLFVAAEALQSCCAPVVFE